MFKVLRALFLFLFISQNLFSQNTSVCLFTFKGQVIDGEDSKVFQGVSVVVLELNKGTITDQFGRFEISDICDGTYTIKYSFLGYKSFEYQYVIKQDIEDKIFLHTDTCSLESVTVYGSKPEELSTFTKSTLSEKQLDRSRGLSLGEVLKEIPGVSTYQTGPSIVKPIIHGLHSNRILILNNGLRQEGQQWGSEHAPEIDPYVSNKITVIKGAAGVRYGSDAVAGVILVEPRDLSKTVGIGGEVNLAGFTNNSMGVASGIVEGNHRIIPALSWRVQGTIKQAGDSRAPSYILSNTAFQERNFSYNIVYSKKNWGVEFYYSQFNTKLGIGFASNNGSSEDLLNTIIRQRPKVTDIQSFSYEIRRGYQNVEHELIKTSVYRQLGDLGKLSLIAGYQFNTRSEYDRHKPYSEVWKENPQLLLEIKTYSTDIIFEHNRVGNWIGTVGVITTYQNNIWNGRYLIPEFSSFAGGLFWIESWRKGRLELEFGMRYDYKVITANWNNNNNQLTDNTLEFHRPSGTIGINYYILPKLIWKNSFGSTFRPPSVNELYSYGFHHGAATFEYGLTGIDLYGRSDNSKGSKSDLIPEQAYKVVSTLEYKSSTISSEISLHYNYMTGFVYLQPVFPPTSSVRGAYPTFQNKQTDAVFYGIDALVDYSLTKEINLIGKTSMVNAWNYGANDYMIFTPPYRFEGIIKYSPTIGNFSKKHQPYLSISCLHVARQDRVPTKNDSLIQLPNNQSIQIVGGDYMATPAAYTLFGAEIGADFVIGKQHIIVSVQATNLFDLSYRDYLNRFRYYVDDVGRNVVLRVKMPIQIYKK